MLMAALERAPDADLSALQRFGRPILSRGEIDRALECDTGLMIWPELESARAALHAARYAGVDPSPVIKIHDAWSAPFDAAWTRATIHIVRDPRDVAVSWAAFRGRSIDWAIDFLADESAWLGVAGDRIDTAVPQRLGGWSRHATGWLDDADPVPLLVRYEDMRADPAAALRAMLGRIGRAVDEPAIAAAVAAGRFDRLADLERNDGFAGRPTSAARFFRVGGAAGWQGVLDARQCARIERDHGAVMRRLGYL